MEDLKILIRNLAFIMLLATFLEMLLPNEKMRGFVQMVMGLFVIAAILSPLSDFLRLGLTMEVPAMISASSNELPVLAQEGETRDIGKSAVREQYKEILENQIKILVLAIDDVKSAQIEVELDKETGGFADYPPVLKVDVVFSCQEIRVDSVDPVIVGGEEEDWQSKESDKAKLIKKQVSSLMQIREEIIFVRDQGGAN